MENYRRWSRVGIALSVIGLLLFIYIYVAIIILGNFLYNPLTASYVRLIKAVPFVAYLNGFGEATDQGLVTSIVVGDLLLAAGIVIAVAGSFLYYFCRTKSLRCAFGRVLLVYSVMVAALTFVTVYVLGGIAGLIFHVPAYKTGFPFLTDAVTYSTCLWKMPNWTKDGPLCYFLNYAELLAISIAGAIAGYCIIHWPVLRRGRQLLMRGPLQRRH